MIQASGNAVIFLTFSTKKSKESVEKVDQGRSVEKLTGQIVILASGRMMVWESRCRK